MSDGEPGVRLEPNVVVVADAQGIADVARRLASIEVLPLDVESNGLHAYRAVLCTVQLALVEDGAVREVFVIDAITAGDEALAPLRALFGDDGPQKIVHDLAFDARILAKHGAPLGNVYDTAIAARFLGTPSTSLASLVSARLGVSLSKELQHHDWGARPLGEELHPYLAADVAYLPALAGSLRVDVEQKGIAEEVAAETRYRLETASAARDDDDPRPTYARIKGANDLDPLALSTLRHLAEVREKAAQRWNVPSFKVVGNDTLLMLSKKRPQSVPELRAMRGLDRGRGVSITGELLGAIQRGARDRDVPEAERAAFFTPPPPVPRELIEARRAREHRLTAWRRAEAKKREVDEQVVLPGHCLQEIADRAPTSREELATIGGIGAIRVTRDGDEILRAVAGIPVPNP